jgi:2,4-dienoyl-CoA reductase-like NADH-dependent reductase (Old Yellow Enzyme family)
MQEAGLDGVELEATATCSIQFWSPLTNTLDPPWGGSLDNRMRFSLEVLAAIRKRVGPDFMCRCGSPRTRRSPGHHPRGGAGDRATLRDCGHVDVLNVIRGRIHTDAALTDVIPIHGMKIAPHLDFAGAVRAETGMPTFHAARIPDVATARHAVAEGCSTWWG